MDDPRGDEQHDLLTGLDPFAGVYEQSKRYMDDAPSSGLEELRVIQAEMEYYASIQIDPPPRKDTPKAAA